MVWLARQDLVRPVDLLEQHHARELVRERHLAEREAHVAGLEVEPARSADHEAEVAAGVPPLLQELAELDRVELAAVACEQAYERALRDPPVDALVLAHLDQLEPRVAGEHLLVVLYVVRIRWAKAPDCYDQRAHGSGRTCPAQRVANPFDLPRVRAEQQLPPRGLTVRGCVPNSSCSHSGGSGSPRFWSESLRSTAMKAAVFPSRSRAWPS